MGPRRLEKKTDVTAPALREDQLSKGQGLQINEFALSVLWLPWERPSGKLW